MNDLSMPELSRRRVGIACTAAEHRPPNGSQTTSPGSDEADTIRSISLSGFWFMCSAFKPAVFTRSEPRTAGSCQTLVMPWLWFHFERMRSHCRSVSGVSPSSEKYGRSVGSPCLVA